MITIMSDTSPGPETSVSAAADRRASPAAARHASPDAFCSLAAERRAAPAAEVRVKGPPRV